MVGTLKDNYYALVRKQRFTQIILILEKIAANNDVASYNEFVLNLAIEWGLKTDKVREYIDILAGAGKLRLEITDGTKIIRLCTAE